MVPLSILDLAPVVEGGSVAQALRQSVELAQHAERWGYRRFWIAEHHGMPGVASAATAVVIGHVAAGTSSIRVGAGGIMLPNHAPLVIAEQFGTLESLFPGRIDLGLGRAPGSDQLTARALRRDPVAAADAFPRDVVELMEYFRPEAGSAPRVRAVPGEGLDIPIWILGSSLFGTQLAAALGLPFAFASHFAPAHLEEALALYRHRFRPSDRLERPHVMLAVNVFAADTEDEARLLATSMQQMFLSLVRGRPGRLPPPRADLQLAPHERAALEQTLRCTVIGDREQVRRGLEAFAARHGADELIVSSGIFDHTARLRSFELALQS